jgi:hypothetical protein
MRAKGATRWGPLGAGAVLLAVLVLLVAALPSASRPGRAAADEGLVDHGPVYTIALPDAPPAVPDEPNRSQFEAYCRLCHSPRLPLTQPRLTQKQWTAVVQKMVKVYRAPIPPEQEPDIVAYLMAVRGREP